MLEEIGNEERSKIIKRNNDRIDGREGEVLRIEDLRVIKKFFEILKGIRKKYEDGEIFLSKIGNGEVEEIILR